METKSNSVTVEKLSRPSVHAGSWSVGVINDDHGIDVGTAETQTSAELLYRVLDNMS